MGLGCWAIGGSIRTATSEVSEDGNANDEESIRAIHKALDMSMDFLDTADSYGCGHSERILARALEGKRKSVSQNKPLPGLRDQSHHKLWWLILFFTIFYIV